MMGENDSIRSRKIGLTIEALENRHLLTVLPVFGPSAIQAVRKPTIETAARLDHSSAVGGVARDSSADIIHPVVKAGGIPAAKNVGWLTRKWESAPAARVSIDDASRNIRHCHRRPEYDTAIQFSYVGSPGNAS